MRRNILIILSCALFLFSSPVQSQNLTPEEIDQLKELGYKGKKAYERGDFEAAADYFEAALEIFEDKMLLLHLGHCYRNLKRYDEAIAVYTRYLERWPDVSDRGKIERYIEEMEAVKAAEAKLTVYLRSKPVGAQIYIDSTNGEPLGTTPLIIQLEAGQYLLFAVLDGFETHRENVLFESDTTLTWELVKIETPTVTNGNTLPDVPVVDEVPIIDGEMSSEDIAGWSLLGSSGGLLATALVLQFLAVNADSKACYPEDPRLCTQEENKKYKDDALLYQDLAVSFFVLGGLSLTIGAFLLLMPVFSEPDDRKSDSREISFDITVDSQFVGLQVGGWF